MDVIQSREDLVAVQAQFDEELNFTEISLDVDEDDNNRVKGYPGVSLWNGSGLVVRDTSVEGAMEVHDEIQEIIQEEYPDLEFSDPELVSSSTIFEFTVGDDEDVDEFQEYMLELPGVESDEYVTVEELDEFDITEDAVFVDTREDADGPVYRLRLVGFDRDDPENLLAYLEEYIEDF